MTATHTRHTDEIEPIVPIIDRPALTDGGRRTPPTATSRPLDTSYATERTRHTEEVLPLVPHLDGHAED